jgi:hypothetical protein
VRRGEKEEQSDVRWKRESHHRRVVDMLGRGLPSTKQKKKSQMMLIEE